MKRRNQRKPQRSPDRTTMWRIGMKGRKVYVADSYEKLNKAGASGIQSIRSITPQAAARRFIRNTLPGRYLALDDVYFWNPSDIKSPTNPSTKYETTGAKKALKRHQKNAKKDAKNTEFVILK